MAALHDASSRPESTMLGEASGRWLAPRDTTVTIAAFDSVPVTLQRR